MDETRSFSGAARPSADAGADAAIDTASNLTSSLAPPSAPVLHEAAPTQGQAAGAPSPPGYEILGELGRGGMGVVFKARQTSLKRVVALKMILVGSEARADALARFRREAEAVARLQHPNIVQVYDVGQHEGRSYCALEYVDGGSLDQHLKGRPQPFDETAELTATLARAVHHAHQRGIVHRDLKPANILLSGEGRGARGERREQGAEEGEARPPLAALVPKITDFGLAKEIADDSGQTRTGAVMGTPAYMAPEQAAGRTNAVGPAADVYALGAILYELLTGRPPFRGVTVLDTLEQVKNREPEPPSRLRPTAPRDLETICLKCLAKEPAGRYASALALANDLDRFRAGEPLLARRPGPFARLARWLRKHARAAAVVLFVAAVVGVAALVYRQANQIDRISKVEKELQAALDATDGAAGPVEQAEAALAKLDRLDPARAAEGRRRLARQLALFAEGRLDRGLFQDKDDRERLEQALALLEARDADRAAELRKQLDERLSRWQPVFRLAAPFAGLGDVFEDGRVRAAGTAVAPAAAGKVLSRVPAAGNVEVTARFRAGPEKADRVGVLLGTADADGYTFVLLGPAADEPGGPHRLQVLRRDVVLREEAVPAGALGTGPLTLRVRREGEILDFQVNGLKALEVLDPFPLGPAESGLFGLLWPAGAALEELSASRQKIAAEPSLVEKGDELYNQGRHDEALALYRQQQTAGGPLVAAAGYKEALCLIAAGRDTDATERLLEVAALPGDRWPVLADCQLLLLLVDRKDAAAAVAAEAVLERLKNRGLPPDQLGRFINLDQRQRLRGLLAPSEAGIYSPGSQERSLRASERNFGLVRLLPVEASGEQGMLAASWESLIKSYRICGKEEEALALARQNPGIPPDVMRGGDFDVRVAEHIGWALRRLGRPEEALREVDKALAGDGETPAGDVRYFPERVRCLVALGRWADAERDADACLAADRPDALTRTTAFLMKGFLREHQGDAAGALAAWKKGVETFEPPPQLDSKVGLTTYFLIMAGLTDAPARPEADALMRHLILRAAGATRGPLLVDSLSAQLPPALLQTMWRSPRGREIARRLAFRDLSLEEYYHLPLKLAMAEALHQTILPGDLAPEQEAMIWDWDEAAFTAYSDGKFGVDQVVALGAVWKGGAILWGGLKKSLPPPMLGPTAYLMGQHYLQKKWPEGAERFFHDAADASPPGSPTRTLADRALGQLKRP